MLAAGPKEYHGALDLAGTAKLLKEKYPDLAPGKELLEAVSKLDAMTTEERAEFWRLQFLNAQGATPAGPPAPAATANAASWKRTSPVDLSHGRRPRELRLEPHQGVPPGRALHAMRLCEAACPQGLPLMLFNAKIDSIVLEEFKAKPGYDTAQKPFIGSWSPDDDNKFIK